MPSGPVYKECMAALAPLRDHQQDSDAVDTLSDCMALVNALVANKGSDCHSAVAVLQASKKPAPVVQPAAGPTPQPVAVVAPKAPTPPKPTPLSKEALARQEAVALNLVSEAMNEVCTDTVRDAEVGLKSEGDALKLANHVAPICQDQAVKHLGVDAAATSLTKDWCHQLDGRLTIALETGFFFALAPDEAERQAAETNPYAAETRRKFCSRFIDSLQKQAKEGAVYLNGPPPATAAPPAAPKPVATKPVLSAVPVVATAVETVGPPEVLLPTIPPAPKPQVVEAPPPPAPVTIAPAPVTDSKPEKPVTPMSVPKGGGTDMLRLLQALSQRNEWKETCTALVSKLTSEEGSVTEEYALGARETAEGTKVLTFNAADQAQIHKCAAQLKVLAIQSGVLGGSQAADSAEKGTAFIETGISLGSADDAEALMDSPWAADACGDVAHGFLTARLAHPGMEVTEFCPLYARDLHAMHWAVLPAERAKQEIQQLRKRASIGSLKRHVAQAQADSAPKPSLRAPVVQEKPKAAALITETASVDDKEGMDFWRGLLQA